MVFGFVLLSTGNPHLYKWEIMFSFSWAVGLRFHGESSLLSKTDQPAAAEQGGNLSCARGGTLQHKSKFSTALVSEEMKAGHREKLMRENNRAELLEPRIQLTSLEEQCQAILAKSLLEWQGGLGLCYQS